MTPPYPEAEVWKKKFKLFEICFKNYKKCKECSTVSISNAFDRHFDYNNS